MPLPLPWRPLCALAFAALATVPASAQLRADGPPALLYEDDRAASHPVWSPDGDHVAFTREGFVGLWTVGADGEDVRQLSDEPAAGFGFAWSPASDALAARVARRDGLRREDAVKRFALSGDVDLLLDYAATAPGLPHWLDAFRVGVVRDGELAVRLTAAAPRLAPLQGEALLGGGPEGVYLADLGVGSLQAVNPLGERLLNVVASPDGQRVAFEVLGGGLHVMDRDGANVVALGTGHRPAWSPDGRWVVFMTTEDDGYAFTAADLAAARADGSARVALTATPDRLEMNPSWSPDGRSIAFDDATDGALYLLSVTE